MNNKMSHVKIIKEKIVQIILDKIAIEQSKSSNIWYRLKLILLCLLIVLWSYFFFINPYILKLQMANNAAQKESSIMYLIHQISPTNEVKYFEIVPIIEGDRIFIIRYAVNDVAISFNKVQNTLGYLGWKHENGNILRKNNFIATIKSIDENTLQITIAYIETRWGHIRFELNKLR